MKQLFHYADEYLKQATWKDLALLKFCLCAIGIIIGATACKKAKKPLIFGAIAVFIATYIPLMLGFFKMVCPKLEQPK